MRTIEYLQYTLISSHIPVVTKNIIKEGFEYGGIKLTYSKRKVLYRELKLGSIRILLPIKKYHAKEITFLRPFKQFWNVKENWLTPNDWGKQKDPYTKIWCELSNGNYEDMRKAAKLNVVVTKIFNKRLDKDLITNLNLISSKFKILTNISSI